MENLRAFTLVGILLLATTPALGAAVTVREPAFGLPHIFADTDAELARENGREIAKDRLGQMILLSRVGRGTIRQPFGILDPSTLDDDIETRRSGYTSSELNNMYAKLPQRERDGILEYCKGVNDTIDAIYAGTLPEPIEVNILRNLLGLSFDLFGNATNVSDQVDPFYAAPGGAWPNAGFQFTPEMVMAIAVLEIRNFGLGGFDEVQLLDELQALEAKHGGVAGTEIWEDKHFLTDPLAPVTVPDPTTPGYGGPLASHRPERLIQIASRYPQYDWATVAARRTHAAAARAEFAKRLGAWPMMGSYAWVIAGTKTASGWPWLGGFPQTGIQTPSIMHFADNRSGEGTTGVIRGLGMEFPGAPAAIIGHTDTVGWTSTTAQLRVIDFFLEQIVGENADVLSYVDEGIATPLTTRVEIFRGASAPDRRNIYFGSHDRGGNGGSRPILEFIGDADGRAESGTATTLVDDDAAFDASYIGGHVAIVDRYRVNVTTGVGQIRVISAVPNATTLEVAAPFTTAPDGSFVYVAVQAGHDLLGVASDSPAWLEESIAAIGFTLMHRADTVLDIRNYSRLIPTTHNFPSADNQAFNGIGTMNGNGNIAYYSSGFSRKGRPDPRLPLDGSSPVNPLVVTSGTVAVATPTTLVAVGTPFSGDLSPPAFNFRYDNPTQQGSEFIVAITSGTGYKQTRRIASNTPSSVTVEFPWGVDPAPGDTFEVYEIVAFPEAINPAEGYHANWNNKAATADEGDNFGRQHRSIFILERLAAENAWDRDKQRQLNKELAGLDGQGAFGRFLIPRLRLAVDRVGNGGNAAVDSVLAALEAHNAAPFLGRYFTDPIADTMGKGELTFLQSLINRLAEDIFGDEYAGAVGVPTGSRALSIVQHAIDSAEGDVPGAYEQAYSGNYFDLTAYVEGFDHFMCYRTRRTPRTPRVFATIPVTLADQLEPTAAGFNVKRPRALCAPASKNGSVVNDPDTHLASYVLRPTVRPPRQTGIVVSDQFGTLTFDTLAPDRLFVPSGKALGGAAAPPTGEVDHFTCYRVRPSRGTPRFTPQQVTVVDQFENRLYDVKRPRHLCAPTDKDGGGINRPTGLLVCYKVRRASGQPRHDAVKGQIHLNNQFNTDQQLDTVREDELCVPAIAQVPGAKGWELIVRDSLSALASAGIPADFPRGQSTYNHPLAALFSELSFPPTPVGNRGTYEQIVDVGPVVTGEFMFPLGQSGLIEGSFGGVTSIDPNLTSMHPVWRDWRFLPMLRVAEDLEAGSADSDTDGVFDAFERWYFGDLTQGATDDFDGDGSDLLDEFTNGSDPTDADTDDDGVLDGSDAAPQDRLVS